MITAIVLIDCATDSIPEVAETLAELPGVSEVYSVAGEYDLVVIIRVSDHDDLSRVIPNGVAKVEGVVRTETLIAFQVYSKHDLDRLFSLGFDEGQR